MIQSVISSSHHYYLIFFDAGRINSITDILGLFSDRVASEEITFKNKKFAHIQVLIENRYGREAVLIGNQLKRNNKNFYWYDMYLGKTYSENKKIFFICFPYHRLRRYLETVFIGNDLVPTYYKPRVNTVLEYMKGSRRPAADNSKEGFSAEIVKYSAAILESANAQKISLTGINPLNSRTFELLNKDDLIRVKTTSLKLRCVKGDIGSLEISFDKLGNYRFWIRRDSQGITIPIIPHAFDFFLKTDSLVADEYIGSQTLLEDD